MAWGGMNWPRPKYTPENKLAWAIIYPGILRPGVYSGLLHLEVNNIFQISHVIILLLLSLKLETPFLSSIFEALG